MKVRKWLEYPELPGVFHKDRAISSMSLNAEMRCRKEVAAAASVAGARNQWKAVIMVSPVVSFLYRPK
jgi:hypothetical protein